MKETSELKQESQKTKDLAEVNQSWIAQKGYYLLRGYFKELLSYKGNIRVICRVKPITQEDKQRWFEQRKMYLKSQDCGEKYDKNRFGAV